MARSSIDIYVEQRLRKWALWTEKCLTEGIGFPHQSAFTKIYQGESSKSSSTSLINSSDEDSEETDKAINSLYQYKPILATVIILRYTAGAFLKEKLKKLNIPYETYKKYLQIAKSWIGGFLVKKNRY
jgi:hypothetical protein